MYKYRWNNDKMRFDVFDPKGNFVVDYTHAVDAESYCISMNDAERLRNV